MGEGILSKFILSSSEKVVSFVFPEDSTFRIQ